MLSEPPPTQLLWAFDALISREEQGSLKRLQLIEARYELEKSGNKGHAVQTIQALCPDALSVPGMQGILQFQAPPPAVAARSVPPTAAFPPAPARYQPLVGASSGGGSGYNPLSAGRQPPPTPTPGVVPPGVPAPVVYSHFLSTIPGSQPAPPPPGAPHGPRPALPESAVLSGLAPAPMAKAPVPGQFAKAPSPTSQLRKSTGHAARVLQQQGWLAGAAGPTSSGPPPQAGHLQPGKPTMSSASGPSTSTASSSGHVTAGHSPTAPGTVTSPGKVVQRAPAHLVPFNLRLYKVTMCQFYSLGRCRNGTRCQFAHAESELREKGTGPVTVEEALSCGLPEEHALSQALVLQEVQKKQRQHQQQQQQQKPTAAAAGAVASGAGAATPAAAPAGTQANPLPLPSRQDGSRQPIQDGVWYAMPTSQAQQRGQARPSQPQPPPPRSAAAPPPRPLSQPEPSKPPPVTTQGPLRYNPFGALQRSSEDGSDGVSTPTVHQQLQQQGHQVHTQGYGGTQAGARSSVPTPTPAPPPFSSNTSGGGSSSGSAATTSARASRSASPAPLTTSANLSGSTGNLAASGAAGQGQGDTGYRQQLMALLQKQPSHPQQQQKPVQQWQVPLEPRLSQEQQEREEREREAKRLQEELLAKKREREQRWQEQQAKRLQEEEVKKKREREERWQQKAAEQEALRKQQAQGEEARRKKAAEQQALLKQKAAEQEQAQRRLQQHEQKYAQHQEQLLQRQQAADEQQKASQQQPAGGAGTDNKVAEQQEASQEQQADRGDADTKAAQEQVAKQTQQAGEQGKRKTPEPTGGTSQQQAPQQQQQAAAGAGGTQQRAGEGQSTNSKAGEQESSKSAPPENKQEAASSKESRPVTPSNKQAGGGMRGFLLKQSGLGGTEGKGKAREQQQQGKQSQDQQAQREEPKQQQQQESHTRSLSFDLSTGLDLEGEGKAEQEQQQQEQSQKEKSKKQQEPQKKQQQPLPKQQQAKKKTEEELLQEQKDRDDDELIEAANAAAEAAALKKQEKKSKTRQAAEAILKQQEEERTRPLREEAKAWEEAHNVNYAPYKTVHECDLAIRNRKPHAEIKKLLAEVLEQPDFQLLEKAHAYLDRRTDLGRSYLPQHLVPYVSHEAAQECKALCTAQQLKNAEPCNTFWHWLHWSIDQGENAEAVDMLLRYIKDNQDVASLRYSVKDPLDLLVRWSRVSDNKRLLQVAFEKKRFKVLDILYNYEPELPVRLFCGGPSEDFLDDLPGAIVNMDHVLGESPQAIALAARAVEYAVKKYGYLALQLVLDHMWSLHHNQSHKRHVPRAVFMIGLLQKVMETARKDPPACTDFLGPGVSGMDSYLRPCLAIKDKHPAQAVEGIKAVVSAAKACTTPEVLDLYSVVLSRAKTTPLMLEGLRVLVEEPPCPGAAAWVNWVISGVGDKSIPVTTGASMLELLLKACKHEELVDIKAFPEGYSLLHECCKQPNGSHELVSILVKHYPRPPAAPAEANTSAGTEEEQQPKSKARRKRGKSKGDGAGGSDDSPGTTDGRPTQQDGSTSAASSSSASEPALPRHLDPCYLVRVSRSRNQYYQGLATTAIMAAVQAGNTAATEEIMKSLWQPQDLERMLRCKDLPAQAWFSFSSWLKQGRKDLDALLSHLARLPSTALRELLELCVSAGNGPGAQVLLLAQPKLLADGVCVMPYLSTPSAAAFLTPECLGQLFAKGAHLTCPSTSVGATQQIETLRNNVLQVWINQMAGLLVTAQRNAGWDEKAAGSKGDASRVPEYLRYIRLHESLSILYTILSQGRDQHGEPLAGSPTARLPALGIKLSCAWLLGGGRSTVNSELVSKVFRLLLESKLVDPNERSNLKLGCTLIQLAADDMSPEIVRLLLEHGADPQATVPSPSSAEAVGVDKGKSAQQAAQLKQRTLEVPGPTCQAADDWLLEDIGILAGGHALHLATRAHSMVDAKDPKAVEVIRLLLAHCPLLVRQRTAPPPGAGGAGKTARELYGKNNKSKAQHREVFDSLVAQYCTPAATAAATAAANTAAEGSGSASTDATAAAAQGGDGASGAAAPKPKRAKAGSGAKAQQSQLSPEDALLLALKGELPAATSAAPQSVTNATQQQTPAQSQADTAHQPEVAGATDIAAPALQDSSDPAEAPSADAAGATESVGSQQAGQVAEEQGSEEPQHGQVELSKLLDAYASFSDQGREQELLAAMVQGLTHEMVHAPVVGPAALAAQQAAAAVAAAEEHGGSAGRQATDSALRHVVGDLMPEEQVGWNPEDDRTAAGDDDEQYSDDDVPLSTTGTPGSGSAEASTAAVAAAAAATPADPADLLADLEWSFTITKEARQSWALLPKWAKDLVLQRLRVMGKGLWVQAGGVKRLPNGDDERLRGMDLWRLKIDKGGRILFEVAVEFIETERRWSECIRLWCITLDHKRYEQQIKAAQASYRRSQDVRERRRLQIISDPSSVESSNSKPGKPAGRSGVVISTLVARLPKRFREVGSTASEHDLPPLAMGSAASALSAKGGSSKEEQREREKVEDGDDDAVKTHLPPATYDPEQFTLLKMYNLDSVLLDSVLRGLTDAEVELPFKLSPAEWDVITATPSPPASCILLGRSGTGKTTCAVYRIWVNWLRGYKEWVPGSRAIAAAAALDAALSAGHSAEEAVAASESAAKALGGAVVFITASATLMEQVRKAFRRMQAAAMPPDEFRLAQAAGRATYHSLAAVPPEAFPLFLSSKKYLHMLDATLASPFFRRNPDGSIIKGIHNSEIDEDSADVVVDLEFDRGDDGDEDEDDEEGGAGGGGGGEDDEDLEDLEEGSDEEGARQQRGGDGDGEALAGNVSVRREVTYSHFVSVMWDRITTPEQRSNKSLKPALVWAEICSFLKGSAEAVGNDKGSLSLPEYLALGSRRAANFSREVREAHIWPIFLKYEKQKRLERRFDSMDLVAHLYGQLSRDGYRGVPLMGMYRDEVQDFTQAELALDLRVVSDPNALFYCGDTAQTISRGIAFRFTDIRTLLWEEGQRRETAAALVKGPPPIKVGMPGMSQLLTNYRTHQGILNTAALIVDLLKVHYPASIDNLARERALFEGPGPILLGGLSETDLALLLAGDRSMSQVEFGAGQVILVRTKQHEERLPPEIRNSNAIIMTVPQAKGLEFDDVILVDFFADSLAPASEWRVLNAFLEDLKEAIEGRKQMKAGLHDRYTLGADLPPVNSKEEGYLRPVKFDPSVHVLLQEELKHLYTAITRAKSNVVVFDRSPERRAPFYNLLRALGMARMVNKSLLEDGSDAVTFGLSQRAKSSADEWHKRAQALMERNSPGLAANAFRQAGDFVRAQVATARQKRAEAAGTDADGGGPSGAPQLSASAKRQLLVEAAYRLLSAVRCASEAPVPVTKADTGRWTKLAAQCLQESGALERAAQLFLRAHLYKKAYDLQMRLNDDRACAETCLAAHAFFSAKADAAEVKADEARKRAVVTGKALVAALGDRLQMGSAARAEEEAAGHMEVAAGARSKARQYLVTAIKHMFLAAERNQQPVENYCRGLELLQANRQELTAAVLQRHWKARGQQLLRAAEMLHNLGREEARTALRLAPPTKERDDLFIKWKLWDDVAELRRAAGDYVGAANVLLTQRRHAAAADMLLQLITARAHHLKQQEDQQGQGDQEKVQWLDVDSKADSALSDVAQQPVPLAGWRALHTCCLALRDPTDRARVESALEAAGGLVAADSGEEAQRLRWQAAAHLAVMRRQQEHLQQAVPPVPADGSLTGEPAAGASAQPRSHAQSDVDVIMSFERAGCALGQLQMLQSLPLVAPSEEHNVPQMQAPTATSAQAKGSKPTVHKIPVQAARLVASLLRAADAGTRESLLAQLAQVAATAAADAAGAEDEASEDGKEGSKQGSSQSAAPAWASTLSQAERLVDAAQAASSGLQAVQLLRAPDEQQRLQLQALEEHYGLGTSEAAAAGGATRLLSLTYQPVCLRDASYAWRSIWSTSGKDAVSQPEQPQAQQGASQQEGKEAKQTSAGRDGGSKEKVPGSWEDHSKSSTSTAGAGHSSAAPTAPKLHALADAPRAHRQQVLCALARDVECKARRVVVEALAHVICMHMGSLAGQKESGRPPAPVTAEEHKAAASQLVAAITLANRLATISKAAASIEQEAAAIMQREQQAAAPAAAQEQGPKQQAQQQAARKGGDTMSLKPRSAWMTKHAAVRKPAGPSAAPVLPEWHLTSVALMSSVLQECVVVLVRQVCGLLLCTGVTPSLPPDMHSGLLGSFVRAVIHPSRLIAPDIRKEVYPILDITHAMTAHHQAVNVWAWYACAVLLRDREYARRQVRNRLGSVPLGTPRDLLIQHRKRWLLPEEVLTAALDAFAYERPVSAVQELLFYCRHSLGHLLKACQASSVQKEGQVLAAPSPLHWRIPLELLLMMLEVVAGTLAMAVTPHIPGTGQLSGAHTYLPSHVVDLLEDSPLCSMPGSSVVYERMAQWEYYPGRDEELLCNVLELLMATAELLNTAASTITTGSNSNSNTAGQKAKQASQGSDTGVASVTTAPSGPPHPALATTLHHQVLQVVVAGAAEQVGKPFSDLVAAKLAVPLLGREGQRARAVQLALRLASLAGCLYLTLDAGRAMGQVTAPTKVLPPNPSLVGGARKVLEEVRCVLEVCSGAASNNSKEAAASVPASLSTLVDSILGARNITTLGQAVAALCAVTGGMKEVVVKNRGKEQEKDKKLDFNGLHKEVLDKAGKQPVSMPHAFMRLHDKSLASPMPLTSTACQAVVLSLQTLSYGATTSAEDAEQEMHKKARIIQTRWRAFLKAREEARRRKELEEARRKLTAVFKKLFGEGGPHRERLVALIQHARSQVEQERLRRLEAERLAAVARDATQQGIQGAMARYRSVLGSVVTQLTSPTAIRTETCPVCPPVVAAPATAAAAAAAAAASAAQKAGLVPTSVQTAPSSTQASEAATAALRSRLMKAEAAQRSTDRVEHESFALTKAARRNVQRCQEQVAAKRAQYQELLGQAQNLEVERVKCVSALTATPMQAPLGSVMAHQAHLVIQQLHQVKESVEAQLRHVQQLMLVAEQQHRTAEFQLQQADLQLQSLEAEHARIKEKLQQAREEVKSLRQQLDALTSAANKDSKQCAQQGAPSDSTATAAAGTSAAGTSSGQAGPQQQQQQQQQQPVAPASGPKSWASAARASPTVPSIMPSARLLGSAIKATAATSTLRATAAEFKAHYEDDRHKQAAAAFQEFNSLHAGILVSSLWWAEVLHACVKRALVELRGRSGTTDDNSKQAPGADPPAASSSSLVALETELAGHEVDLRCGDSVMNTVAHIMKQRTWGQGQMALKQEAGRAVRQVMDACKALGRGGLAHLVTDALRDTRLVCGERLVPAVLTKEEREAELQAVKAGELPPALLQLAQMLGGWAGMPAQQQQPQSDGQQEGVPSQWAAQPWDSAGTSGAPAGQHGGPSPHKLSGSPAPGGRGASDSPLTSPTGNRHGAPRRDLQGSSRGAAGKGPARREEDQEQEEDLGVGMGGATLAEEQALLLDLGKMMKAEYDRQQMGDDDDEADLLGDEEDDEEGLEPGWIKYGSRRNKKGGGGKGGGGGGSGTRGKAANGAASAASAPATTSSAAKRSGKAPATQVPAAPAGGQKKGKKGSGDAPVALAQNMFDVLEAGAAAGGSAGPSGKGGKGRRRGG